MLSLCSNPSTGYRWTDPVSSNPTVASVGGWAYVAAERDLPGASGTEDLTIVAAAPGTAVISASYDQPWEGGAKGDWTVELTVEVIETSTLIISCDEFEASPAAVRSVDLAAGTSLAISLCSNPTTGFRWSEPVSSAAVASVNGWVFEAPEATEGMTGAPGMEHVSVLAGIAGSAVMQQFVRPALGWGPEGCLDARPDRRRGVTLPWWRMALVPAASGSGAGSGAEPAGGAGPAGQRRDAA